jgi:hypothetical protein
MSSMQIHRSDDGESPQRRANPSPPVMNRVHGLGESHALRVDFEPVQLPWLADEIDTLQSCVEDELARARSRHDHLAAGSTDSRAMAGEAEDEVDRRAYQLQVLRMIREQVPVSGPVAAACVASPWDDPSELAWELARITAPVTVVGPAQGMLVLIRGAARNVTDALGEALRISQQHVAKAQVETAATRWPERHLLTAAVANRLRDLAAAAQAFTGNYVDAVWQQAYSFDPEHYPVYSDELW